MILPSQSAVLIMGPIMGRETVVYSKKQIHIENSLFPILIKIVEKNRASEVLVFLFAV